MFRVLSEAVSDLHRDLVTESKISEPLNGAELSKTLIFLTKKAFTVWLKDLFIIDFKNPFYSQTSDAFFLRLHHVELKDFIRGSLLLCEIAF